MKIKQGVPRVYIHRESGQLMVVTLVDEKSHYSYGIDKELLSYILFGSLDKDFEYLSDL